MSTETARAVPVMLVAWLLVGCGCEGDAEPGLLALTTTPLFWNPNWDFAGASW